MIIWNIEKILEELLKFFIWVRKESMINVKKSINVGFVVIGRGGWWVEMFCFFLLKIIVVIFFLFLMCVVDYICILFKYIYNIV